MSDWLAWRKARWQGKDVPDYMIDTDGTFHCDCGCANLSEHEAKRTPLPTPPTPAT